MQRVLQIDNLPIEALAAAAVFYGKWLPKFEQAVGNAVDDYVIALPPASYTHRDWRKATARDLARQYAPIRINIVAGRGGAMLDDTFAYLAGANGVTGQYLELSAIED